MALPVHIEYHRRGASESHIVKPRVFMKFFNKKDFDESAAVNGGRVDK